LPFRLNFRRLMSLAVTPDPFPRVSSVSRLSQSIRWLASPVPLSIALSPIHFTRSLFLPPCSYIQSPPFPPSPLPSPNPPSPPSPILRPCLRQVSACPRCPRPPASLLSRWPCCHAVTLLLSLLVTAVGSPACHFALLSAAVASRSSWPSRSSGLTAAAAPRSPWARRPGGSSQRVLFLRPTTCCRSPSDPASSPACFSLSSFVRSDSHLVRLPSPPSPAGHYPSLLL